MRSNSKVSESRKKNTKTEPKRKAKKPREEEEEEDEAEVEDEDDDEDYNDEEAKKPKRPTKSTPKTTTTRTRRKTTRKDEEDDDNDEEEEEEEVVKPKPRKRKTTTTTTAPRTTAKRKARKADDDADIDEIEEEIEPLPKKRRTRKTTKYVDGDEDEDDEEEEEDPKKEEIVQSGVFGLHWKQAGPFFYVLDSPELKSSTKIAAFDMDGTLIEPKTAGRKFAASRTDWKWWHKQVPVQLKRIHSEGFKIVIFSNQAGIEKKNINKNDITGKIIDIAEHLGFPIQALVAGAENVYRKPNTNMWDYMVAHMNGGVVPDMNSSFFCGDAAGRPANWKPKAKKDFACSDRKFALNVGLPFHTPDTFFLEEEEVPFKLDGINPKDFVAATTKLESKYHTNKQEMVIFVGCPASGKSTFARKYFLPHGYHIINRDTLGTTPKCKAMATKAIKEGASVVIDNTNGSEETRGEFITIAIDNGVPVRCFYFTTPKELANHLNYVRVRETNGAVRRIPDVAYKTYNKRFVEPSIAERFQEIITIPFVPDFRGDPAFEEMFTQLT